MAVYTKVSAEAAQSLLQRYDVGQLTALKGIAEGVENSNFLLETDKDQFILTLYESRVDPADLPYFRAMLSHLHRAGCNVPRFIEDREGQWLHDVAGRKACLIEFLDGVSVSQPTSEQAFAVGAALAQLHNALEDFTETRPNPLGLKSWRPLFGKCAAQDTASVKPDLSGEIADELEFLEAHWPTHLPQSAIHADLFPDNVLMLNGQVTGLIDFYFACTDVRAYDVAVTHAAWSFNGDGSVFQPEISAAILNGYKTARQFSHDEYQALPILARGACMRFLLTRLFDWINTPAGALVTRKDPLAFLRRLHYYRAVGHSLWT